VWEECVQLSNIVANFKSDLAEGEKYANYFMSIFPIPLIKTSGKIEDFKTKETNETIELKSDRYDVNKTTNFFMERYSNMSKMSNGGPWQALGKSEFFIYFFPNNNIWYIFNTKDLVKKLDILVQNKSLVYIPNNGYITGGYTIQRKALQDLFLQIA